MQTNTAALLTSVAVVVTTLMDGCHATSQAYAVPPPCNADHKPDIGNLDTQQFEGNNRII